MHNAVDQEMRHFLPPLEKRLILLRSLISRDTKCLVLIGSHIGENMHNGQVQEMSDAIDKGATIITVDPRFSTAAGKSKFWLPIKPATDIALLLTWIHEIIYNDTV